MVSKWNKLYSFLPKGCDIKLVVLEVVYLVSNLPNAVKKFWPALLLGDVTPDPDIITTDLSAIDIAANSDSTSNAA